MVTGSFSNVTWHATSKIPPFRVEDMQRCADGLLASIDRRYVSERSRSAVNGSVVFSSLTLTKQVERAA